MNVLITGATGFIGRRLAADLAAGGHTVTGLSRDPEVATAAVPAVARFFPWRAGEQPPRAALDGVDAVVHLAGESVSGRWTAEKKRQIAASRVEGTRALVAALGEAGGGRRLVSASAVGYYGDRGDAELTEEAAAGRGFLAEVTQDWEREALRAEQAGCRVALMRLGIVLGPEGGALAKLLPLFRFGLGGALGNGRQWWPWVHIDDAVAGLAAATRSEWTGPFNLTAPEPVRQAAFAAALGRVLHRPAVAPVPAFVLRLTQGGFADELLFSRRVVPARLLGAGFDFRYPSLLPALRQLVAEEKSDAALPSHA